MYAIQLYWVFDSGLYLDDPLLHVYAFGCVAAFIFLIRFIHSKLHKVRQERTSRISFLENLLDLYTNKQSRENNLVGLKALLSQANRQYDRGEISKDELQKVLYDVYYEYKVIEEDDDKLSSLFFNGGKL